MLFVQIAYRASHTFAEMREFLLSNGEEAGSNGVAISDQIRRTNYDFLFLDIFTSEGILPNQNHRCALKFTADRENGILMTQKVQNKAHSFSCNNLGEKFDYVCETNSGRRVGANNFCVLTRNEHYWTFSFINSNTLELVAGDSINEFHRQL